MKTYNIFAVTIIVIFVTALIIKAEPINITILSMGDTHSCLTDGGNRDENLKGNSGGIARAATAIGMIRALEDPNAIVLHSGDLFIGDLFFVNYFGVPDFKIMKALQFDAMTLGNHEFDLTPDALYLSIDSSDNDGLFPILCTNANFNGHPLSNMIQSSTVINKYNKKIGVFGLTTQDANSQSQPAPVEIIDPIVAATTEVAKLRNEGCDVIIMLSHLGNAKDAEIAASVNGIDLICGGHDHYIFDQAKKVKSPEGKDVPIVQSGAFYQNITKTILTIDDNNTVSLNTSCLIPLDESIPEEPTVKAVLDELIVGIENTYGKMFTQTVGYIDHDFRETASLGDNYFGTDVGQLVTNSLRAFGQTDIAIIPGGSTSQGLKKGYLIANDIYRMIGYGFNTVNGLGYRVIKIKMKGMDVLTGIGMGLMNMFNNDEFLMQSSGLTYRANLNLNDMSLLPDSVMVNGLPIDPEAEYTVMTNEFVTLMMASLNLPFELVQEYNEETEFLVVLNYILQSPDFQNYEVDNIEVLNVKKLGESDKMKITNIFPNPCSETVSIEVAAETSGEYNLSISNMLMQEIVKYSTIIESGNRTIQLNTSYLNSGVYYLKLSNEKAVYIISFMVSK